MTIKLLTIEEFNGKVGNAFTIEESDFPAVELTLIEAKALPNFGKAEREPFSLLFTSQGVGVLPQRQYTLRHAGMGPRPIFLVPIGQKGDVVTYQAIFN
jgi:hypothetical protein